MMQTRRDTITIVIGSVALAAVLALLGVTHYRALLGTAQVAGEQAEPQAALNIPSIEQMCAASGLAAGDALTQCQADESSAGEYVIAWMGLNGFIADGAIALDQIQLLASLDGPGTDVFGLDPSNDPSLTDPSLGGDPSLLGDPALGDSVIGGVTDPLTGETSPLFQSPAQLALYCLSQSGDWIKMHDCISENDPSSRFAGGQ